MWLISIIVLLEMVGVDMVNLTRKRTNKTERITLRLPPSVKAKIVSASNKSGMSINDFLIILLKEANIDILSACLDADKDIIKLYIQLTEDINRLTKINENTGTGATVKELYTLIKAANTLTQEIKKSHGIG